MKPPKKPTSLPHLHFSFPFRKKTIGMRQIFIITSSEWKERGGLYFLVRGVDVSGSKVRSELQRGERRGFLVLTSVKL